MRAHLDGFVEGKFDKFGVLINCVEGDKEGLAEDREHSCGRDRLKVEVILLDLGSIGFDDTMDTNISRTFKISRISWFPE